MDLIVSLRCEWLQCWKEREIPTDCHICRDAGMMDFHLYIALLCLQWVENTNPLLMFVHVFRIDLVIVPLCCYYLYCSKRVYSIFLPWFEIWDLNLRVCWCLLVVAPLFWHCYPVLSLAAFWVLINFCHEELLPVWLTLGSYSSHEITSAMALCAPLIKTTSGQIFFKL